MRYEAKDSPIHHPWRKRWSTARQTTEPLIVEGRGIWDRERRDWHVEPAEKSKVTLEQVRALNGMVPLTAARVTSILRKAGHQISQYAASRQVRGWGDRSAGAMVRMDTFGRIEISEGIRNHDRRDAEAIRAQLAKYAMALAAANFEPKQENGQWHV